jgi:lysyl-tRNA synthetase class 2
MTDASGSIQLIASKSSLSNYQDLYLLDLGDIIEISGLSCLSKTGEISILLQTWKVLTKSHLPPPEKFSGLSDEEVKYRQRYLDLLSSEETRARFIVRSMVIKAIRQFMETRSFMEVETPTLSAISSGANAKPFNTFHNSLNCSLQLRIAPELYLKRLLVGGYEKVFEIGKNYRNEGLSPRHNPEFTMLESYEAYGNFKDLISHTSNLWNFIISYLENNLPASALNYFNNWMVNSPIDWSRFHSVSMLNSIEYAAHKSGIDLSTLQVQQENNPRLQKISLPDLSEAVKNVSSGSKIGILFEHLVEPFLTEDYRNENGTKSVPVFITDYPKDISPLARASDQDPNFCDRFELFVNGQELANAFQELNDPQEQFLRFQQQLSSSEKDPMAFDQDYIEALEYGMPPAIGLGLGIDRLVSFLTNSSNIKDVILFPTLKPIELK